MEFQKSFFGKTKNNQDIFLYQITNDKHVSASFINYGAAVVSIIVPDKNGVQTDVVLGYDSIESYMTQDKYMGATIGRHANRLENAMFTLNGKTYHLYQNDGKNHLHGGKEGFDKKVWEGTFSDDCLVFSYTSPDMEEGFPGNLTLKVCYCLTEENELKIDYFATTDADTIVSVTNHTYFNLGGHDSKSILEEKVMIDADYYTANNKESLPTGDIVPVENTPMDFRTPTTVGARIDDSYLQIQYGCGYDHNWVINGKPNTLRLGATVTDERTGIQMDMLTTFPGVQFYTGNFLDGVVTGKQKASYPRRSGLCLEAGLFPNSMMHDNFPSPILKKGTSFHHTTIYRFSTIK